MRNNCDFYIRHLSFMWKNAELVVSGDEKEMEDAGEAIRILDQFERYFGRNDPRHAKWIRSQVDGFITYFYARSSGIEMARAIYDVEKIYLVKLPTASFCLRANPSTDGVGHLKNRRDHYLLHLSSLSNIS